MSFRASVQLNKKDLFLFLLNHMYFNVSGVVYTIVAAAALAGGIFYLVNGNMTGWFLIAITLIYFGVMPAMLYVKAAKQSKNEIFSRPTLYRLTEDGLYASQEGTEESHESWDQVRKVCRFRGEYIIYISQVRASVIPAADLYETGEELHRASDDRAAAFFLQVLPKNKLKGIHA